MNTSLLSTMTRVPPRAYRYVDRARLSERLESGVPAHRLTLVSAPAGYGKTTAVAAWAREASIPVAWVTAGPGIDDAERFLRAVLLAWESVEPEIGRTTPGLLLGGREPDLDAVLTGIVALDRDPDAHLAVVIDDAHLLEDPTALETLTFLLEHLPPWMHVVLATRGDPPLPLARYRARQELLEIRVDDLAFTIEDTARFLAEAHGATPPAHIVGSLRDQTEGWAAGLQLATLTLPEHALPTEPIRVRGQHRFIADYLREDVLAPLPDATRRFLHQTSILDRMCGSLCDAVTGETDGQRMLEWLERQGLFTTPLDDHREWYRYHPLFADILRDELRQHHAEEIAALDGRAAAWYLARDMPELAFPHALAAANLPLMFDLLNRFGMVQLFTGRLRTLQSWLDALPGEWYARKPELGLLRVALMLFTGRFEQAFGLLEDVERTITGAEEVNEPALGRVTAVRCFIACELNDVEQAERFAESALQLLSAVDDTFRAGIYGALGDVYRRNGRWDEADRNYRRTLDHSGTYENYVQSAHAYGALADLGLRRGRLHEAAGHWRRALEVIDDPRLWGAYPLPLTGWVHLRLGEILYEWNQLEAVREHLELGRDQARLGGDPRSIIAGTLLAARLELAKGNLDAARRELDQARAILSDSPFPEWQSSFDRIQVDHWLASDQLRAAVTWSDSMLPQLDTAPPPDSESSRLALARVLVAKGDPESNLLARTVLEPMRDRAAADGRLGIEVDTLALLGIVRWAANDVAGALTALRQALELAEPEGHVRTFVDVGRPMARLLQEARDRSMLPDLVQPLLGAFDSAGTDHQAPSRLTEPLSDREREVLAHIATGLTNSEIADLLFISPETVKKHTSSIYAKLGVRHRIEAVAAGRRLGELD